MFVIHSRLKAVTQHDDLSKNHLAVLIAMILMMLIAAASGYRLQISTSGLVFERAGGPEQSRPQQ
jgi:hypothetical protein